MQSVGVLTLWQNILAHKIVHYFEDHINLITFAKFYPTNDNNISIEKYRYIFNLSSCLPSVVSKSICFKTDLFREKKKCATENISTKRQSMRNFCKCCNFAKSFRTDPKNDIISSAWTGTTGT